MAFVQRMYNATKHGVMAAHAVITAAQTWRGGVGILDVCGDCIRLEICLLETSGFDAARSANGRDT